MIQGSIVAIVTPMHPDGSLDLDGFKALLDWHVEQGTDAVVVVGTSGESATLSVAEHCELIKVAVGHVGKRIPVIAGAGGNSTTEAIELTRFAKEVGAAAALSVVPYYNKPTQEGLYQHFRKIAESVDIPIIVYNVPGRTVADLSNDTVLRLAEVPGIVGIKDATADIGRGISLVARAPEHFAVYSGDDASAVALMLMGGRGNVSVSANVIPKAMHQLCTAALAGNAGLARSWQKRTLALHSALFVEANPIPVKWALHQMGRIGSGIRLPLTPLAPQYHEPVRAAMRSAGIAV